METSRKKLEQQEERCTAELNGALEKHKELQEQAVDIDPDEIYQARLGLRVDKECSAVDHVQSVYGEMYQPRMMDDSRKHVSQILGEKNERQSIFEKLEKIKRENRQVTPRHQEKKHDYERYFTQTISQRRGTWTSYKMKNLRSKHDI